MRDGKDPDMFFGAGQVAVGMGVAASAIASTTGRRCNAQSTWHIEILCDMLT